MFLLEPFGRPETEFFADNRFSHLYNVLKELPLNGGVYS